MRIDTDKRIERAAKTFDVPMQEVTDEQIEHVKAQEFAENYGYRGTPVRTYIVNNGNQVEFLDNSSDL